MVDIPRDLRGLILSATELRGLHPEWSGSMIEDYLSIFENILTLVDGLDLAMAKVPGAEEDNLPIFDDEGQVKDSGISINDVEFEAFFLARNY